MSLYWPVMPKELEDVAFIKMNRETIEELKIFLRSINGVFKEDSTGIIASTINDFPTTIYGFPIRESIACPEGVMWLCNSKSEIVRIVNLRKEMKEVK